MDEDRLNKSVRAFLKRVGITSQREIEKAARDLDQAGKLKGKDQVGASVVLRVPDLGVEVEISDDLDLE